MEIMFEDLTEEAQERLLEEAGVTDPEDMHWDEVPVAIIDFEERDQEPDEEAFLEDVYDDGYDEQEI
jgi:hypothetical protein